MKLAVFFHWVFFVFLGGYMPKKPSGFLGVSTWVSEPTWLVTALVFCIGQ